MVNFVRRLIARAELFFVLSGRRSQECTTLNRRVGTNKDHEKSKYYLWKFFETDLKHRCWRSSSCYLSLPTPSPLSLSTADLVVSANSPAARRILAATVRSALAMVLISPLKNRWVLATASAVCVAIFSILIRSGGSGATLHALTVSPDPIVCLTLPTH
jgi:hypothetical protein